MGQDSTETRSTMDLHLPCIQGAWQHQGHGWASRPSEGSGHEAMAVPHHPAAAPHPPPLSSLWCSGPGWGTCGGLAAPPEGLAHRVTPQPHCPLLRGAAQLWQRSYTPGDWKGKGLGSKKQTCTDGGGEAAGGLSLGVGTEFIRKPVV